MSPEKQKIAIAEALGWKRIANHHFDRGIEKFVGYYQHPSQKYICVTPNNLPDYPSDLNAMHKAEEYLGDIDNWLKYEGFLDEGGTKFLFHATAAQRAEAFLRVLNLWEE